MPLGEGQTFAGFDFGADRVQAGIIEYNLHVSGTRFEEENLSRPEAQE